MNAPAALIAQRQLETTVLVVPGMHCAGCMAKVERGLGAVSGVESARVNLTAKQVRVEHAGTVEANDLIAALEAIGFASQPRSEDLVRSPSAVKPLLAPLAVDRKSTRLNSSH